MWVLADCFSHKFDGKRGFTTTEVTKFLVKIIRLNLKNFAKNAKLWKKREIL